MKILLFHQYFLEENDPGGSRWNELTKFWANQGHEITVIAGMMHANGLKKPEEYKGKYFAKKAQGKVNVIRCHVSESYNANFIGRLWGYFSFMISSLLGGLLLPKGEFDVVITTSPPLFIGISGYLVSIYRRGKFIFEVRDLWPESAIDTGVLKNKLIIKLAYGVEKFLYSKAKIINVLTPAFYKTLNEKKDVPENKLILIPNAADFSLSEKLMESFNVESFRKEHNLEGHFVLTYVGAHGVANHLEQILDTANLLKNTNVLFLLIGQGMEKERLKAYANKLALNNVRFIDPVPKSEVFKYILASEMGLSVLKKVDTFKTVYSNKTFDYMSCKKPILMAIDGVSRELVEDAKAGTYVEPENPEQMASIIKEYLTNPERLKTEGTNGYNYAKTNFDRKLLAEKYLSYVL